MTNRRKQAVYIDDENIPKIDELKKGMALSNFLNWALRSHFQEYDIKHCPHLKQN